MDKLFSTVAGLAGGCLFGGIVGWLAGITWYELIEVPYANQELEFWRRPSYLCSAGNALALLAIPGALIGAVGGLLAGLSGKALNKRGGLLQPGAQR